MVAQRRTVATFSKLSAHADRQLGLVTRSQAHEAGITLRWLERHSRSGELTAMEVGVFLLPGRPRTWEVEALAACLVRGPSARLAFGSAARVWSLADGQVSDRIHVLVPTSVGVATDGKVQVHRTRNLVNSDVAIFDRLPVTSVARTILDLAALLSPDRIERVIDDALVRQLTTVPLLSASLRRNGHSGRRGSGAVREALEEWSAGPLESRAEVDLAHWLRRAGSLSPCGSSRSSGPTARLPASTLPGRDGVSSWRWMASPTTTGRASWPLTTSDVRLSPPRAGRS